MPARMTHTTLKTYLSAGRFDDLLIDELGWDTPEINDSVSVSIPAGKAADAEAKDERFLLTPVAGKRSVHFFSCDTGDIMLTKEQRRKIERQLDKYAHEHLIIFHTADYGHQIWQVPQREPGKPIRLREFDFIASRANNALVEFVDKLYFSLRDEENLTLLDVTSRLQSGVAAEKVTKKFYDEFSKQKTKFIGLIEGIADDNDRGWYAAIMLNRLMFSWFLQSKGFLDNDTDYLPNKLREAKSGKLPVPNFQSFYETFLHALFHEGFNEPEKGRSQETKKMLGKIPYINGGIFERHRLERENSGIQIPDQAFEEIFALFGRYTWHLDDRPVAEENEINPDVLGHIFEKFVNQKEKGAYYTKEDVTGYISQNTIIPWLLDRAKKDARIAFDHTTPGSVWDLLKEQPERYIYPSMKHGVIDDEDKVLPLPDEIAAGENDISQRGNWNERATAPYNLPTETWREYVHRRNRTIELRQKLANGDIHEIDDLITYNLDIRQFMQDIVERAGGIELVKALWKAVSTITILDPTVGSGAFLFAAVRVLEPIANGLLDRMEGFVEAKPQHHPRSNEAEFARILAERNAHPNQNYYVMRQIVLNNLYGVDIEEEAVEICKLRLFLLLAAQIERGEKIEPLPDIDFNIRPGNTLVGYASLEEVEKATSTGQMALDLDGNAKRIEEQAELADRSFQKFKRMQVSDTAARADLYTAKESYKRKISSLRDQLDRYLYNQQATSESFESWKIRTQPFHWFAEFHQVAVADGGFSVIMGNPPYISATEVRKRYTVQGLSTSVCPNVYAWVMERSYGLLAEGGKLGEIVPLSLSFSTDFRPLREIVSAHGPNWFSSFDIRPAALFIGTIIRCTIVLSSGREDAGTNLTRLNRWKTITRPALFEMLEYFELASDVSPLSELPRLSTPQSMALYRSILRAPKPISRTDGKFSIMWAKASGNFFSAYLEEPPVLEAATLNRRTSNSGSLRLPDADAAYAALSLLIGDVFMWYWWMRGDGLNVPNWLVSEYLSILSILPDTHMIALSDLGRIAWSRKNEVLIFSLYARLYVGNYDFRAMHRITRRADLLLLSALGMDKGSSIEITDFTQRTLLANDYAGEKTIPDSVRALFPRERNLADTRAQAEILKDIDSLIRCELDLTPSELESVISSGYPQWSSLSD